MTPLSREKTAISGLLFIFCAFLVLGLSLATHWHGIRLFDDAYMFVRYADHILQGHGMVWNVGEGKVYGATSLAYVFALIPFRLLFPDNATLTLFCSSMFWGIMMIVLLMRMALVTFAGKGVHKAYLGGFVALMLVTTGRMLKFHFASGMETTLVMTYMAGMVILFRNALSKPSKMVITGCYLGFAWWLRPDLMLFSFGLPIVLMVLDGDRRMAWLRLFGIVLGFFALALILARWTAGTWLPTSFYIKGTAFYGKEYAAAFLKLGWRNLSGFVVRIWPIFVLLGLGAYVRWPRLLSSRSQLEWAWILVSIAFALYYTLLAQQVMGFAQRFYYPLFPVLVYLGLCELRSLPQLIQRFRGLDLENIPMNWRRIGMVAMAAVLVYYGQDFGRLLRERTADEPLGTFETASCYQASYQDYWPKLLELRQLEGDWTLATTEVGMPAALFPAHTIHDIAALNNATLIKEGLNGETIMKHCAADLIFMPHSNYTLLNHSLRHNPRFLEAYEQISGKQLQSDLDVAIKRDSPFYPALMRIYAH